MTPADARARFEDARVARLASVGRDGAPHVVPITFALDGDTIVTAVDAKPKRGARLRRVSNLEANPRASVLVDRYDDDWALLWWARADGLARIVTDGPDLERAFELLRARYPQYARFALTGPAILIRVEKWTGWASTP